MDPSSLLDVNWDAPFFKRLTKNDSGDRESHQAGFAVPNELAGYFPDLGLMLNRHHAATTDRYLDVAVYLEPVLAQETTMRFQSQTWGRKRPPEHRITQLGVLDQKSHEDDVLVMQRHTVDLTRFRFVLYPKAAFSRAFPENKLIRWGPVFADQIPLTQVQLTECVSALLDEASTPFKLFVDRRARPVARLMKSRNAAFSASVRKGYDWTCAVSGVRLDGLTGRTEVEAAHIVPVERGGSDDLRNGLALTRTLHWAFDQYLFGFDTEGKVFAPEGVARDERNGYLLALRGKPLREPGLGLPRPHPHAIGWHREQVLVAAAAFP
jgi:putative restriction endonuclease